MSKALENLLQRPDIWRADTLSRAPQGIASGFPALDAHLPGGGWPIGALTEILVPHEGIGELRLVMPALARLSQAGRWLAWIAPPQLPYAPALAAWGVELSRLLLVSPRAQGDALWATEQALRCGTCAAVLTWPRSDDAQAQRRLQLAAEEGRCLGILFRSERLATRTCYAALRLRLEAADDAVAVSILKRRGGGPVGPIHVAVHSSRSIAAGPDQSGNMH